MLALLLATTLLGPTLDENVMLDCGGRWGQAAPISSITALTAKHIECAGGEWRDKWGQKGKIVGWTEMEGDLALFRVPIASEDPNENPPRFTKWYKIAKDPPPQGAPVYWRAYLPTEEHTFETFVTKGTYIVLDKTGEYHDHKFYHGYGAPGVSGGGLVNELGELLGILSGGRFPSSHLGIILPWTPTWRAQSVIGLKKLD